MHAIITIREGLVGDIRCLDATTEKLSEMQKLQYLRKAVDKSIEAAKQREEQLASKNTNQIDLEDSINDIENGN